MKHLW